MKVHANMTFDAVLFIAADLFNDKITAFSSVPALTVMPIHSLSPEWAGQPITGAPNRAAAFSSEIGTPWGLLAIRDGKDDL